MYQITLSIASFFMLFLGLFVFTRDVKRAVNKNFALLSASLSIWGFGMLALALVKNRDEAIACLPILHLGLVFGGPALFAFILSITEDKSKINRLLSMAGYTLGVIFFLLHLGGKFGSNVLCVAGYYRVVGEQISPYFNLFLCSLAFYSCYLLYKRYRISTSGTERNRLGYLFLGIFVATISTLTNILRISGFDVYPLFHIGLLFFNAMTAYAIVRYRLMDITIIIRRALVYSILTFLTTGLWLSNVFIFSKFSVALSGYQTFFSIGVTALLIAFTFLPVRNRIQSWVDTAFFAQRRELEDIIHEFGLTVSSSFNKEYILNSMIRTVLRIVDVEKISIMVINKAGDYPVSLSVGINSQSHGIRLNPSNHLTCWLVQNKRSLLRRELNENPDLRWVRDDLIQDMKAIEAALVIPLFSHHRLIGLLNLEEKTSAISYSEEEMALLETLAAEAILAFENIKFFDERINLMINTIDALCMAIEAQNKFVQGHSQLIANYAVLMAKEMELDEATIEVIKIASFLHDIGNIGVSEDILHLDGRLTIEEFEKIKEHVSIGRNIVHSIQLGREIEECILYHHERMDGSGYPFALKGEAIPVSARILSVADAFVAMIHERSYRMALSQQEALGEIQKASGQGFDPLVVTALLAVIDV